jgi:hypothetical protein
VRLSVLHLLDYVALCKSDVFMSGGDVRGSGMSVLRHLLKRTMWGRNVTLDGSSEDDNFGTESAKITHSGIQYCRPVEELCRLEEMPRGELLGFAGGGGSRVYRQVSCGLRVSIYRVRDDM